MHLKRNIAACAGTLLVLVLGVAMVCGGCKSSDVDWNYTGTFGKDNETEASSTDGTTRPTGNTQPTVTTPEETTTATEETTVPTESTSGGTTSGGTTGGNTGGGTTSGGNASGGSSTGDGNTSGGSSGGGTVTTPENTTEATETTESTETTETTEATEDTETTEATTEATESVSMPPYLTLEQYEALSSEEQMEYCGSFPTLTDFNNWYNAAKAEYDAAHPKETIGPDGNIDLN